LHKVRANAHNSAGDASGDALTSSITEGNLAGLRFRISLLPHVCRNNQLNSAVSCGGTGDAGAQQTGPSAISPSCDRLQVHPPVRLLQQQFELSRSAPPAGRLVFHGIPRFNRDSRSRVAHSQSKCCHRCSWMVTVHPASV